LTRTAGGGAFVVSFFKFPYYVCHLPLRARRGSGNDK
jgi:hypothetical protein